LKTILVVDDEPMFRLLMQDALAGDTQEVILAGDGEEAIEKLEEIDVDLIISDIYMPVMDGFKMRQAIRSNPKWENIPILFVSAYDDQHTMNAVQNPRIEGFVRKGRSTKEIQEWIDYLTASEEEKRAKVPGQARAGRTSDP
jgi:CheY-like chemotaxis protein